MNGSILLKSALILIASSLGTYNYQDNKSVSITNFNSVSVSSGIDLYLTQGNTESIRINAPSDLLKNVIVEKEGTNLKIRYKSNVSWSRIFKGQSIKVYINYKTLEAISASGGSDVFTQNTLKTERLSASASGGSDLDLNVITRELKIQSSGGSDVDLKGTATSMEVSSSGGSDVNALGLVAEYAKVSASGGSDANVNVTKALEASANGGSDINYRGNPSVKKTSSGRSGDVNKIK